MIIRLDTLGFNHIVKTRPYKHAKPDPDCDPKVPSTQKWYSVPEVWRTSRGDVLCLAMDKVTPPLANTRVLPGDD